MPKIKVKEPKAEGDDKIYLNNVLNSLFEKCYDLQSIIPIKVAFHALPLRSYTDYYKIIKKPQSLHKIAQLIKGNRYSTAQEFVVDMTQISWNARFYNEIGSDYYETAVVLDNYIKDEIIPALKSDPKIFGGAQAGYPYLGPLPGEEPATFESIESASNQNNIMDNYDDPQEELYEEEEEQEEYKEPKKPRHKVDPIQEKSLSDLYHEAEVQLRLAQQHQQSQQYAPVPQFSTLGIPESVFRDYEPTPVEQVPTLDQGTAMTPKPSPIVLNTTTALPPHPNQRAVFETWNKRGKPPVIDKPHEQRVKNIMRFMKKQRNSRGELLYMPFEKLPNHQNSLYYRKIQNPMCLEIIRTKTKQRKYPDVESFLTDLFLIIENNKLYASQAPDPTLLNDVIEFESVCKKLISEELAKPDTVYLTSDAHGMRVPIDILELNGRKYKIGDWVLLRNPNDETKPIPAQIFRIWSTPEDGNKRYINVCWYYRPEQTVHRVDRLFYENEVFKTGQYRDHLIQDILGPCYVNYFTRYQRGEPAFKVAGPMFVCEFRYSDHDKNFNKIRTWKACIPDEVREIDDPIIPLPNGGLRWFQKYTSPLMHLLPPNAQITDPIPEPIIASLNAPPLIGGVYKRGPLLDDDLGQYLSSPARNLVVRKNITLLNNIGTRNDSPMPTQQQMLMQLPQKNGTPARQFSSHQFSYSPSFDATPQQSHQSSPSHLQPSLLQQHHLLQQQLLLQQQQLQQQQQQQQLQLQQQLQIPYMAQLDFHHSSYYKNSGTQYHQAFTGKIVPSPYSHILHAVSNFQQSTSSAAYIVPNRLQKKLDDNEELTNIFASKMDNSNKERLMKYAPSYMTTELQQYDLLNKLKEPSSVPKTAKRKLDVEEEEDDEEDEYSDETGEDDEAESNAIDIIPQEEVPISKKTPALWFRGSPVVIKNRIVNESEFQLRNDHILRFNKGVSSSLHKRQKTEPTSNVAKEEFLDNLPPARRRGRKSETEETDKEANEDDTDEEEEIKHVHDEEVTVNGSGLFGYNRFGPSAEYLAFKLRQTAL